MLYILHHSIGKHSRFSVYFCVVEMWWKSLYFYATWLTSLSVLTVSFQLSVSLCKEKSEWPTWNISLSIKLVFLGWLCKAPCRVWLEHWCTRREVWTVCNTSCSFCRPHWCSSMVTWEWCFSTKSSKYSLLSVMMILFLRLYSSHIRN